MYETNVNAYEIRQILSNFWLNKQRNPPIFQFPLEVYLVNVKFRKFRSKSILPNFVYLRLF